MHSGSQMASIPMFKVGYLNLEPDGWIERGNLLKENEYFIHFQKGDCFLFLFIFFLANFDWVYNMPQ